MTKTIAILKTMDTEGLETSTEIADHLGFHRGTVAAFLAKAQQRKLVRKAGVFHPHDYIPRKPMNRWALTEAGMEAIA